MRVIGYFVSLIGALVLAVSVKPVKEIVAGFLPEINSINNFIIMGFGIVILVIGVYILKNSSGGKQVPEVPIYKGKNIVGYRRMK